MLKPTIRLLAAALIVSTGLLAAGCGQGSGGKNIYDTPAGRAAFDQSQQRKLAPTDTHNPPAIGR